MKILRNHHVLAVHDARATARYFVDALGFGIVHEDPGWVFVQRDHCMIMLGECRGDVSPSELGSHSYFGYLLVDDVDAYHAELEGRGVRPLDGVRDKPWGLREFALRTPEGHRLTVGQVIAR